ncbi:MAG: hypothetical protein HRU09_20530 [Oligoflexales bacterium]|nr:hypothetical protein [Oligoflexales bacterium]
MMGIVLGSSCLYKQARYVDIEFLLSLDLIDDVFRIFSKFFKLFVFIGQRAEVDPTVQTKNSFV